MLVVFATQAIFQRYPGSAGVAILDAIRDLGGTPLDVSGKKSNDIRGAINDQDPQAPVCLIGGYELLPTFTMDNPTAAAETEDRDVLTDGPYGARNGNEAEFYLPSRPVSRLPDSKDAAGFVALLKRAKAAPGNATPAGAFEQAASEFEGAADLVHKAMPGQEAVRLSPPHTLGDPTFEPSASNKGRMHIILHGANRGPRRNSLWGRGEQSGLVEAVRASDFRSLRLNDAIVSFSSCYSAMLESVGAESPRTPDNQVALACLAAGAKAVYGCTRANWIDTLAPFDSFGTALTAKTWEHLRQGKPVAQALRDAKLDFAQTALQAPDATGWTTPFVLKTLLQTHCYGHPLAKL